MIRRNTHDRSEGFERAIRGGASSLSRGASRVSHRRIADQPYAKGALALSHQRTRHVLWGGGGHSHLPPASEGRGAADARRDVSRPAEAPAPRHQRRRYVRRISGPARHRRLRFCPLGRYANQRTGTPKAGTLKKVAQLTLPLEDERERAGARVRRSLPSPLQKAASRGPHQLLRGKAVEQAVAAGAPQVVLAAAAVGPARGMRRIPRLGRGIVAQTLAVDVADHGRALGAACPVAAGSVLAGWKRPPVHLRAGKNVV